MLLNRVFHARLFELLQNDLVRISADTPGEMQTVGQDVCELVADVLRVGFGSPLVVLEELGGFDGDAFGEVLRRVKAVSVALGDERRQHLLRVLAYGHGAGGLSEPARVGGVSLLAKMSPSLPKSPI